MILKNITIGLIILGIVFILLGLILKRKKIKYIGITIFAVIIVFWIGFYIWAIYDASTEYERRFGNEMTNNDYKVESNEEDKKQLSPIVILSRDDRFLMISILVD